MKDKQSPWSRARSVVVYPIYRVVRRILYLLYFPVCAVYWWLVRRTLWYYCVSGLHAVNVGEYTVGGQKLRSIFKEDMFMRAIPLCVDLRGKTCLDLACNDGRWSLWLGRFGIVKAKGVDSDARMIRRANFLKTIHHYPSFEYQTGDVLQFLDAENGKSHDIVLLLGLLYHLPSTTDWTRFFGKLSEVTRECLIIDSRWHEDEAFWFDRESPLAFVETRDGKVPKWRPTRREVASHLRQSGFAQVFEIELAGLLADPERAFGNGNPYGLENVAEFVRNNRNLLVAYKASAKRFEPSERIVIKAL